MRLLKQTEGRNERGRVGGRGDRGACTSRLKIEKAKTHGAHLPARLAIHGRARSAWGGRVGGSSLTTVLGLLLLLLGLLCAQ